jgi:VWFA-related protein
MQRRLFLLGILLILAVSLHAQRLRDAVTVEVVDVPVFVSRDGVPVEGLTRDNFELYVNGQPQPIDYFDVVTPSGEPSLHERRLFLLVFDEAFSRPHSLVRAQKAAMKLIDAAPASDLFAIATFSSRYGIQFATPFSADRDALERAVAKLATSESGDPLAIMMTAQERATVAAFSGDLGERPTDAFLASMSAGDRMRAEFLREMALVQVRHRAHDQIAAFSQLSERLGSLDGQKHVVLLSEGFDGAESPAQLVERRMVSTQPFSVDAGFVDATVREDLRQMYRAFQRSDVFLHTLDLEGLRANVVSQDALQLLATGTGGEFVHDRNDLTGALGELSRQFSHGYRLGFRPTSVRMGHNNIKVKVRNAHRVDLRYRYGFAGTPQSTDVDDGLYLADVVLNDVPQTGTAAALEVTNGVLHARVPMEPLAAQLGQAGKAELLVYVFDAGGKAIAYHEQNITVPANAIGESTFDIALPAGAKVAKALLRVDESLGFTKVSS